jgi:hypothetical protein
MVDVGESSYVDAGGRRISEMKGRVKRDLMIVIADVLIKSEVPDQTVLCFPPRPSRRLPLAIGELAVPWIGSHTHVGIL